MKHVLSSLVAENKKEGGEGKYYPSQSRDS